MTSSPVSERSRRCQNTALRSRNLIGRQGRTSIRLESTLWEAFDDVRNQLGMTSRELSLFVDQHRPAGVSFTSAIRIFLVNFFRGYPQRAIDVEVAKIAGVAALSGSDSGAPAAVRGGRFRKASSSESCAEAAP